MINKYILPILCILVLAGFSGCRQDDGSPIRNVKFDPNLLNQARDGSSCNTYSYGETTEGQQNLGVVNSEQVLIAFEPSIPQEEYQNILSEYGFVRGIKEPVSTRASMFYSISLIDGLNCKQTESAISILAKDARIKYAGPYFFGNNNLIGLSNEVLVTLKSGNGAILDKLMSGYKGTTINKLDGNIYAVKLDKSATGNILQVVNYLQAQEEVAHAKPDFASVHSVTGL